MCATVLVQNTRWAVLRRRHDGGKTEHARYARTRMTAAVQSRSLHTLVGVQLTTT